MGNQAGYAIDESNLERQRLLAGALDPFARRVLEKVGVPESARCLDLGCGLGGTTRLIAEMVSGDGHVLGVDRDAALLAAAEREAPGLPISFMEGDAARTGLPAESFDLVFTRYLLCHMEDPVSILREMFRVAKPGGVVVALEPDLGSMPATPGTVWEKTRKLSESIFRDSYIGRKLPELFRAAGAGDVGVWGWSPVEYGETTFRRTWRMTFEALREPMLKINLLTPAGYEEFIRDLRREEEDRHAVFMCHATVGVWARKEPAFPHGEPAATQ